MPTVKLGGENIWGCSAAISECKKLTNTKKNGSDYVIRNVPLTPVLHMTHTVLCNLRFVVLVQANMGNFFNFSL